MSESRSFSDAEIRSNETAEEFVLRLEQDGAREVDCRKALRRSIGMSLGDAIDVCRCLTLAKSRELEAMRRTRPNWTDDMLGRWVARSMGISLVEARAIVASSHREMNNASQGADGERKC